MNRAANQWRATDAVAPVLLVVAFLLLLTAFDYPRASALFPKLSGGLFVLLCAFETIRILRRAAPPATAEPSAPGGLAWLGALLVGTWLLGFLLAVPLFIAAFIYYRAGRPLWQAATFAVVVTALIAGLFAGLLNHRLYAGLLFSAAGQG